jgi:signal transduction histidine kinase
MKIDKNKYNGSIRKKLILIIFISTFVTSIIGYGGFVYWFMNHQYSKVLNTTNIISNIISKEAAKLIVLDEVSSASEISIYLRSFKNLDSLVLYNLNKEAILQYSKNNKNFKVDPVPNNIDNNYKIVDNKVIKYAIIKYQDSNIGYIQVKFEIFTIYDLIKQDIYIIFAILSFIILLTLFISIFYSKKFTDPIINLVQFLETINLKDTLQNRIVIKEDNEFGKLSEEVNKMLDRIYYSHKELKQSEQILIQQSKMAALGEMIENISHQWRQPLTIISSISSGIILKKKIKAPITVEYEIEKLEKINSSVQYLSHTIDDFRTFFKIDKDKKEFNIKHSYEKTINMISSKFYTLNIKIIEDLKDVNIIGLQNELTQVFMNILNNARDELEKVDHKKLLFVHIYQDNNNAIIKIKDNAGGVPNEIISKIFNSHFTTKKDTDGTGIGLYMSKEMITNHMDGTIEVKNETYYYANVQYTGACFTITIPIK